MLARSSNKYAVERAVNADCGLGQRARIAKAEITSDVEPSLEVLTGCGQCGLRDRPYRGPRSFVVTYTHL